jgi:hypothetical protein
LVLGWIFVGMIFTGLFSLIQLTSLAPNLAEGFRAPNEVVVWNSG